MSGAFSRESDLTGVWTGEYWYGVNSQATQFAAHITDDGGSLSGTTLEPATFGASPGDLSAVLAGTRSGLEVTFTKRYDPAPGVHQHAISYTGTVDSDLTVIAGAWSFGFGGFGGFQMRRISPRAKAEVKTEAKEPVTIDRRK